jgi:hypothetical protein
MAALSFISTSKLVDLLNAADERQKMFVRIVSANRLALGVDPLQPTLLLDLSKEKIGPYDHSEPPRTGIRFEEEQASSATNQPAAKVPRRSGDYWFEMTGQRVTCRSLKELLRRSLGAIEKKAPGTLEKLSNVKARSRRIVAREPSRLFDKEHLAKKYAEQLLPGWWYGTNNSGEQVRVWLKRACELSGVKWRSDFKMQSEVDTRLAIDIEL